MDVVGYLPSESLCPCGASNQGAPSVGLERNVKADRGTGGRIAQAPGQHSKRAQ